MKNQENGVTTYSSKQKTVAAVLGMLLGPLGIMDFYAGKVGPGIIKLILSCTGIGAAISMIWTIANMFGVANESYLDGEDLPLSGDPKTAKILAIVTLVWDIIAFVSIFVL